MHMGSFFISPELYAECLKIGRDHGWWDIPADNLDRDDRAKEVSKVIKLVNKEIDDMTVFLSDLQGFSATLGGDGD